MSRFSRGRRFVVPFLKQRPLLPVVTFPSLIITGPSDHLLDQTSMPDRLRLHISPFNPSILATLISPAVLNTVDNISYHTLQTFPERNYGYLELPTFEAEKIKKKYGGTTLKGAKMHIEKARKEKKRANCDDDVAEPSTHKRPKVRRTKGEEGVIPGLSLPDDRQVQRGWTKPPSHTKPGKKTLGGKHKTNKSLYTTKAECLFKATLSPNVTSTTVTTNGTRKRKSGSSVGQQVVVHEFSNTTKHSSFLREVSAKQKSQIVSEFVDGKGWVDGDGNVVETTVKDIGRVTKATANRATDDAADARQRSQLEATSSNDSEEGSKHSFGVKEVNRSNDDETSSSGTSSDGESSDEEIESAQRSDSSAKSPSNVDNPTRDIHPLEAIFKRPKHKPSEGTPKPSLTVSTSFNFFDPDAKDDNTGPSALPQTPFTRHDFQQRRQRSAAPTPDTAAPGRTFSNVWQDANEEPYDETDEFFDEEDEPSASPLEKANRDTSRATAEAAPASQSEFAKWFWEHRGETNRAWKKRRREAAKEKRHRENKRRSGTVI